jgi:Mrp family chromosome partitioning ATPase
VDADLRTAGLSGQLGLSVTAGWEDVLGGEATLGEVVVTSLEDNLALVPRRQVARPGERLTGSLRSAVSFDMLREHFDLVLVDGGSGGDDDHIADLAACAALLRFESVYLVFDRRADQRAAAKLVRRLADAGLAVRGAIENFAASRVPRPHLALHEPAE